MSKFIALKKGATIEDILRFEVRENVRLPSDFADYFMEVNGFNGPTIVDDNLIAFLPLEEVRIVVSSWYVFADYSLGAHYYAIKLTKETSDNPISVFCGSDLIGVVSDSFRNFTRAYLMEDMDILFPNAPGNW